MNSLASLSTVALMLLAGVNPAVAKIRPQNVPALPAATTAQPQPPPQSAPKFEEWADDFGGKTLDEGKWERFSFAGTGGGVVELKDSVLHLRGMQETRAGVRSKPTFTADRFSIEAALVKVGAAMPMPGEKGAPLGFANLTILFDGTGRNRIEWALTSEGTLEAWSVVDGRGERLDNRKLGTKIPNPVLAIIRKGDEFLFVLNKPDGAPQDAQVALTKKIKNMPRDFRVMLYGFGSSVNNWDAVRVVTAQ